MKEKLRYFLEMIQTKKYKKIAGIIGVLIIFFYLSLYVYSFIYEQDKLTIDRYNFEQLAIFDSGVKEHHYAFNSLSEFNDAYNLKIKPIKNCYYLSSDNGKYKYTFAFKLESLFYKVVYLKDIYIHGKAPSGRDRICFGYNPDGDTHGGCQNFDFYKKFLETISNPCEK